jgi:N-acetylglucosaminyl-diphospho-decaprenol L-rhamnosyltransferase
MVPEVPRGIAAVVVNFNAGDHLTNCVRSLRRAGVADVVVVDNASSDGSPERLVADDPGVQLIRTGANLGYGGGANRGLRLTTGADAVLVLNPDVVVDTDAVAAMVAALDSDAGVGIVGPRVKEVDGSLYPSARAFPKLADAVGHAFVGLFTTDNPFSRRYLMADWDHATGRDVEWVSGACFLARPAAVDEIDGFDEAYFMYLEDVDLCWRIGRAGWRVRYEPAAHVTHVQGLSTDQAPYRMLSAHHSSLLRFWWRTTPGPGRLLAPVVVVGLGLRLALMVAKRALLGRGRR